MAGPAGDGVPGPDLVPALPAVRTMTDGVAAAGGDRPRVLHIATVDMSLALLLGPQLRAFAAAGYEVIGASAPGPYVAALEDAGIRHIALRHATRALNPVQDARLFLELRALCARLRPDIVHTHTPKPNWFGRPAAWVARVPVVVNTVHGLYATPDDRKAMIALVYSIERCAAAFSDAELVQNPEDIPVLHRLRIPRDRVHLLGNGVDLDRFDPDRVSPETTARLRAGLGATPETVIVGVVARLVWEKGFREIFTAAEAIRARLPGVRFVVVGPVEDGKGDGVGRAEIDRARELGMVFLGMRDDVEDLYAAMDVYVLASHREGFPRSAMEAAAMGLPIVTTDIRGGRQVVDDGETGLLVPVKDPAALTGAIVALAGDPLMRARMGAAARDKAKSDFDQRNVIRTTLDVYERLLADRRREGRGRGRRRQPI